MNGFAKLTRETWKFYLGVLVISLVCVISNSLYLCGETKFQYVDDNSCFYAEGIKLSSLIVDKAEGYDLISFFTVIAGIIIVLSIRHIPFMEQRGKEFQVFLPVKQRTIILHDFLCMIGIIVISFLAMTGIFLSAQTKYNKDMLEAAYIHNIDGMNDNLVILANKELLQYIFCYFLFILLFFAIIYLGIVVCKNCMAGMLIAICTWRFVMFFLEEVYWFLSSYYSKHLGISTIEAEQKSLLQKIENLQAAINPQEFFCFGGYQGSEMADGISIWITIGLIVLLLLMIVLAAGKIEISKGKLFYFSFLDYVFAIICGIVIGYGLIGIGTKFLLAFVIGCCAAVVIWRMIHPGKRRVINDWEVR